MVTCLSQSNRCSPTILELIASLLLLLLQLLAQSGGQLSLRGVPHCTAAASMTRSAIPHCRTGVMLFCNNGINVYHMPPGTEACSLKLFPSVLLMPLSIQS